MGMFCTQCGRPLADGEVCNCTSTNTVNTAESVVAPVPQPQVLPQGQPQIQETHSQSQIQESPITGQAQSQPQMQGQYQTYGQPQVQPQVQPQMQGQYQAYGQPQGQPQMQGQYQTYGQPQGQPQMQGQYQNYYQPQMQQPSQPSAVENYFKNLVETTINIVKKPITASKEFVNKGDMATAFGYMLIQIILVSLFAIVFELRVGFKIKDTLDYYRISMPYIFAFLGTIFLSAVFNVMLAGMIFAINLLINNKIKFEQAICLASIRSLGMIPVTIVGVFVVAIIPGYGVLFTLLGSVFGLIVISKVNPILAVDAEKTENLLTYLMFAAMFLFAFIVLAILYSAGHYIYAPEDWSVFGILNQSF